MANDSLHTLYKAVQPYITLRNIIIILIAVVVIYLLIKWWLNSKEGFEDKTRVLTDLLDKQKVNLYELASIWDNRLYSSQPKHNERAISIWRPTKEAGTLYKEIGHCASDNVEYNSPEKTTMLVKGDTKPPVDSKLIFSFPDNLITASQYDKEGNKKASVMTGIRKPEHIEERLEILNDHLEEIQELYDTVKADFESKLKIIYENTFKQQIELSGKDSFFITPAQVYNIEPGQTIDIQSGEYASMRLPIGSKVSLTSSTGRVIEFEIPYSVILNDSLTDVRNNGSGPGYREVLNSIQGDKFTEHDFNLAGRYGFGARDNISNTNDIDTSSASTNFQQTENQAYMPWSRSVDMGVFGIDVSVDSSFNYIVSDSVEGHNLYGHNQVYTYYNSKMNDTYTVGNSKDHTIEVRTGTKLINFSKNANFHNLKERTENYPARTPGNSTLNNAMIHRKSTNISVDYKSLVDMNTKLINTKNKYKEWYVETPTELDLSTANVNISVKTFAIDLAFMMTTYQKTLRKSNVGGVNYASDVEGEQNDACKVDDSSKTEESLSRNTKFQGYLKYGTVTLNIQPEQNAIYINARKQLMERLDYADKVMNGIISMINQLETLKQELSASTVTQFPLKIYRAVPPPDYTDLGDLIYNHDDPNYRKRKPQLDTVACVPSQCVRDVREWLPVDRIYEYSQGDVYLAIYRNPYLQTFRVSTVPGVFPPGKVIKVVACVEKCKLLDDIIEADKCAKNMYNATKLLTEKSNLDADKPILERESGLYKNEIANREDKLNTMRELNRRLQIQDKKADLINKEHNRQQLQNLIDTQRVNMNKLVDELDAGRNRVDVNVKFDYDKFAGLITILRPKMPDAVYRKIVSAVSTAAKEKIDAIPDETVNEILGVCPSPEMQGLVVKALVESGCYGCANLS